MENNVTLHAKHFNMINKITGTGNNAGLINNSTKENAANMDIGLLSFVYPYFFVNSDNAKRQDSFII